jgi:uncharacterized membrane protein
MSSPASIAKHPIHPMLVVLPIGLWIFSLVSDVVYLTNWGSAVWKDVALYTMAGGTAGALIAAVPGFVDLISMSKGPVKKIGIWHMSINLTIVVLYAINLWLRTSGSPSATEPVWLSVVGVLLLGVSGWLGGEMVYVHGVAVEPQSRQERAEERAAPSAPRRVA